MKMDVTEFESKEKKVRRSFQGIAAFVIGLLTFAWQTFWVVLIFSNPMLDPQYIIGYIVFPSLLTAVGIVLGVKGVKGGLSGKDRIISKWGIILNCIATIPSCWMLLIWFLVMG